MTQTRILAYGAYIPFHRLARSDVSDTLGTGGGRGSRSVASYDEDTTSMGVEAARRALRALDPAAPRPTALYFATGDPAYLEKSNASAVHAALGLDLDVGAYDMAGGVRSGMGALRAASERMGTTLVVLADLRTGRPGGSDESAGGDGAVAFVTGREGPAVAEVLGFAGVTEELLDRWRLPGESWCRTWEERFGESALVEPGLAACADALKQAGLAAAEIDRIAVCATSPRAAKRVGAKLAADGATLVDDLSSTVGFVGTAHAGLMLANALAASDTGQVISVVALADGADALLVRSLSAAAPAQHRPDPTGQVSYASFLTWRGHLDREGPRRPDPLRPTAPAALRSRAWKFGFVASRCESCDQRHLPPQAVCLNCRAAGRMTPERMADVPGTIVTYSIDRLAYSVHPPVVAVVVDFDGGGRFQCELTDADPSSVHIGQRVEMTFRRLFTADGVHNYFWKARPFATERGRG